MSTNGAIRRGSVSGESDYSAFIHLKTQLGSDDGFDPIVMPAELFDFQEALVTWALRKGRAALYEDCGLGKSIQQLVWADNVVRHTNRPVLILTPLAVSHQTVAEGHKFNIDVVRSPDGKLPSSACIVVTNYERLHYFNPNDFSGLVCDESSILKSFSGATRKAITEFMRKLPYRLLCTATAAPNDYIELGSSSEALGYLGHLDMLNQFFKNDENTIAPHRRGVAGNKQSEGNKWRLKGHAEEPFWRWVCSWARAIRRPSDLGFDDSRFILPPLTETEYVVKAATRAPGLLFDMPAIGLYEQREERKRTINERCEKVASLVSGTGRPALVWCHLNAEGDLLEKLIPDSVQVSGRDSDDEKEEAFLSFVGGSTRVLVIKPKIGALGLNLQHCSHVTFFPSHSYEQYYQGVRRCWRFGQSSPVQVDLVSSEGERGVMANLQRKAMQADRMFTNLVAEMNRGLSVRVARDFTGNAEVPQWM